MDQVLYVDAAASSAPFVADAHGVDATAGSFIEPAQLKVETAGMPFAPTADPGVGRLVLTAAAPGRPGSSLVRLAPGARLPEAPPGWGVEALILHGTFELPEGPLRTGGYSRRPPGSVDRGCSSGVTGCTLFVRSGPWAEDDSEVVHLQTDELPWLLNGKGEIGLSVKRLQSFGDEGTALVHWPAGERFIPHSHWGGEEVLVLEGTFEDEKGAYPTGTWTQSAHLSEHNPFTTIETVIFVKTGHLPPPGGYPKDDDDDDEGNQAGSAEELGRGSESEVEVK